MANLSISVFDVLDSDDSWLDSFSSIETDECSAEQVEKRCIGGNNRGVGNTDEDGCVKADIHGMK